MIMTNSFVLLAACLLGMASATGDGTQVNPFVIEMSGCGNVVEMEHSHSLTPSAHMFFAFNLTSTQCGEHPPKVFDVLMRRTSDAGDPDLYMFSCPSPALSGEACVDMVMEDHTVLADHALTRALAWTAGESQKMFLVLVVAYGRQVSQFQIGAIASTCPADVNWSGGGSNLRATECGGSSRGTCSANGTCACQGAPPGSFAPGSKYVLPDCSGNQYPSHPLGSTNKYIVKHHANDFVPFSVDENTYELIIDVVTTEGATVRPSLYSGGPEGAYMYFDQDWTEDAVQITLTVDKNTLPTFGLLTTFGEWALKLHYENASDPTDMSKSSTVYVSITENKCPSDCTGNNGVCNATTHICTCKPAWAGHDCGSPRIPVSPDVLTYDGDGIPTIELGEGLEGQTFSLNQEETMILRFHVAKAPLGSTFQLNVTSVYNHTALDLCPSYPLLAFTKEVSTTKFVPGKTTCNDAERNPAITLCGAEFEEGDWHLTVYAAGGFFAPLNFTVSARVTMDRREAMNSHKLAQAENSLENCATGTPNGIAALLFFIGGALGVVGGVVLAKLVLVPKGIGFIAPKSAYPAAPKGVSFAQNDGGHSLLTSNPSGHEGI